MTIEITRDINEHMHRSGAVEVPTRSIQRFEQINKVNRDFIVKYCNHTKELIGTARDKSLAYFNKKLIRYSPEEKCFFIDPLPGCHTIQKIIKRSKGFECSCQKCQEKMKKGEYDPNNEDLVPCSHIGGLFIYFKLRYPVDVNLLQ